MDRTRPRTATHVDVRFYGSLVDLAGASELRVPFGHARSIKDLIESLGVPHPELGLLVLDGRPVGFGARVTAGSRVAAYPPFRHLDVGPDTGLWPAPPAERRFVLDVHLGTLARRLRLLGFDTWYSNDVDDATLADVAVADERILLTRDRELLMRRVVVHGYCPRADDPDRQLAEVVERYDLSTHAAPFTRCARCNGRLRAVTAANVEDEVPPGTRRAGHERYARCGRCGQLYWPGAHHQAVTSIVQRGTQRLDDTS